jgi:hypothetical protein
MKQTRKHQFWLLKRTALIGLFCAWLLAGLALAHIPQIFAQSYYIMTWQLPACYAGVGLFTLLLNMKMRLQSGIVTDRTSPKLKMEGV